MVLCVAIVGIVRFDTRTQRPEIVRYFGRESGVSPSTADIPFLLSLRVGFAITEPLVPVFVVAGGRLEIIPREQVDIPTTIPSSISVSIDRWLIELFSD